MCSNVDRRDYAKKLIRGRGKNVLEQRSDRRQRLVEKFKSLRIQAIDSFRNLRENDLTYELLFKLKEEILMTLHPGELLQEDELTDFFKDLEEELEEQEKENYERLCNEEIETITNNLMEKCDICSDLIVEGRICEFCAQQHFSGQF